MSFKGTLIRKSDGVAVGQVSATSQALLMAQADNEHDVVEGWDAELEAPILPSALELVRDRRNKLLDANAWTFRADSPLTPESQAAWLTWAEAMQRVTIDFPDPETVVWPEMPELVYANES